MGKKEAIVKHSGDEIAAMLAQGEDRTDWARVDAKSDAEIAADAASDPAWIGDPEDWHTRARAATKPLIRPTENKQLLSVRYDADVVQFFKGQGRGWQARMNAVLRSFMESSR